MELVLISLHSVAEPWIDTSNIFLRAYLQLLSDKYHHHYVCNYVGWSLYAQFRHGKVKSTLGDDYAHHLTLMKT